MTKPLCIYHSPCADGFTAAWAVNRALSGEVDFHPGVYGEAPPDVAGRDVILVDFSYKRPVLDEMAAKAMTILILDHHGTAADDLAGFEKPEGFEHPGAYNPEYWRRKFENYLDVPVRAIFDMDRSGAQIAWDFFFCREGEGNHRPALVDYVGDRDLWRFKLPKSRDVNAYIFAHEYSFEEWDRLDWRLSGGQPAIDLVGSMGAAIEKKHHKDVAEIVRVTKRRMIIGGHTVPVANIPWTMTSDAGHLMAQDQPFSACYWDVPNGRVFSLRSAAGGLDVSVIAKGYGGGGHPSAAGFQAARGWEGDGPC
jgi:oligoribonuclease NrnB/cAMP/cGMP phosphodiesterase (DHH superfamily)